MNVTFVSTVGTSLLNNLSRAVDRGDLKTDLDPDAVRRAPRDPDALEDIEDELEELLSRLIEEDPTRASAELNTLLRMLERAERRGLEPRDVALIPTDTRNCLLCSRVVARYLREEEGLKAWETEPIRAPNDPRDFWIGLNDLVDRLERTGVTDPSREVWVAASAGFKPETAVLTLVASLFGKPVFYVHESMRELVEIPPVTPIVTDPRFVLNLIELTHRIGDGATLEEVENILDDLTDGRKEERERFKMFLTEIDEDTFKPSPLARLAGDFLALGLAAAGSKRYDVKIKAGSHTVPVRKGGRVTKGDEATLAELPLEDDTKDVLATVAAMEDVDDVWIVSGEWTVTNTGRHEHPVKVIRKEGNAVLVSVRDSKLHISRLRIPTRHPERTARAIEWLSEAARG